MRQAELDEAEESIRIGGRRINNLRYADDTTLLASTKDHLRTLIKKVRTASAKAGLELNLNKTKVMSTTHMQALSMDDKSLEAVEKFIFLLVAGWI